MIYEWIINNLNRDGVVVEAGMCNGQDTEFLCKHCLHGKVYGFEPVASIFEQARIRVGHYLNVVWMQLPEVRPCSSAIDLDLIGDLLPY